MRKRFAGLCGVQSVMTGAFSTMMVLALMCSLSIHEGHAGRLIADKAEDVRPLTVGQRAPRFEVQTVDDEPFVFDPDSLNRPTIIVIFRGGWCPFCNMHLAELRTVIPEVAKLGVDVIFLSGDRPELLYSSLKADTQEKIAGLDYRIFSDADAQAAIAFGIAFKASARTINRRHEQGQDIEQSSMMRHGILPVPAVYAIDVDGQIAFSFVEPDYKIRLPADELLAAAQELVQ